MDAYLNTLVTPTAVPSKFDGSVTRCLIILTVAAIGMWTLLALLADTGHDQLWLLLAAQRMEPNLNPYNVTVFESNPPLAIWMSALVIAAAQLLHLSLTVAFKFAVTVVAAASAAVCAKLVRILHPELSRNQLWILGIAFVVIFGAVPVRDFGQRDHILALLVLPYLFGAALDVSGHRVPVSARMAITLAAAIGLALKPHQALIPIAVATLKLRVPHPRPEVASPGRVGYRALGSTALGLLEPAIFVGAALVYVDAIHLLAPTYLSEILPILRDTYWAFGDLSLLQLLQASIGLQIVLTIALVLYMVHPHRARLVLILLAAGIGADLAYMAQGTGWYYQQLPAICFLSLATVFQLLDFSKLSPMSIPHWVPIPIAGMTLVAFALTVHFSEFRLTSRGLEQAQTTPDPAFFENLPVGTSVATLTTSVDETVPPAFRYHLVLAQRYPHLWMLPAILRNESGPTPDHIITQTELDYLDRLQHQFMVEDLNRWHPALILVARCQDPAVHCETLEDRHDDLLAWFLRDPAFALLFSKYRFLRSSGMYDAYGLN